MSISSMKPVLPPSRCRLSRSTRTRTSRPTRTAAFSLCQLLVLLTSAIQVVQGALQNATIDDDFGDSMTGVKPQYLPTTVGVWAGEDCGPSCTLRPNTALANNGTYTAATFRGDPISFSFQFTGSALYVFLTLANSAGPAVTTLTETNFTIDNEPAVLYRHQPDPNKADFDYQALAFNKTGLEHRTHTFIAQTAGIDHEAFLNFDYAIYTYDDTLIPNRSASASTSSATTTASPTGSSLPAQKDGEGTPIGPIVGGVIGGVVILAMFIVALVFIRRRYRNAENGGNLNANRVDYPDNPEIVQFTGHLTSDQLKYLQQNPTGPSTALPATVAYNNSSQRSRAPYVHHSATPSTSSLGGTAITSFTGQSRSTGQSTVVSGRSVRKQRLDEHGRPVQPQRADVSAVAHSPRPHPQSIVTARSPSPAVQSQVSPNAANIVGSSVVLPPPSTPEPPVQSSGGTRDLDGRVRALQQSISAVIADIQAERDAMSRRGVSEEQMERSLVGMRDNLRVMAEQMTVMREGGHEELLPEYESPTGRRLPFDHA